MAGQLQLLHPHGAWCQLAISYAYDDHNSHNCGVIRSLKELKPWGLFFLLFWLVRLLSGFNSNPLNRNNLAAGHLWFSCCCPWPPRCLKQIYMYRSEYVYFTFTNTVWPLLLSSNFGFSCCCPWSTRWSARIMASKQSSSSYLQTSSTHHPPKILIFFENIVATRRAGGVGKLRHMEIVVFDPERLIKYCGWVKKQKVGVSA